jgi:hypothetical protein
MSISEKYGVIAAIDKSSFPTLEFEISGYFASISFKFGGRIESSIGNIMKHHSFHWLHSSAL